MQTRKMNAHRNDHNKFSGLENLCRDPPRVLPMLGFECCGMRLGMGGLLIAVRYAGIYAGDDGDGRWDRCMNI